jgi:hypothetical protein
MGDILNEKENAVDKRIVVPDEPKRIDPKKLGSLPVSQEDSWDTYSSTDLEEHSEDTWHTYNPKDLEDSKAKAHNREMDAKAREMGFKIIAGCLLCIFLVFLVDVCFPARSELSPVVIEICKTSLLVVFGYIFGKGSNS